MSTTCPRRPHGSPPAHRPGRSQLLAKNRPYNLTACRPITSRRGRQLALSLAYPSQSVWLSSTRQCEQTPKPSISLDLTSGSVATCLPKISSDLHGGRQSSWVATAYLLTYVLSLPHCLANGLSTLGFYSSMSLTPLYGRWSDIFGRKPVLLVRDELARQPTGVLSPTAEPSRLQ